MRSTWIYCLLSGCIGAGLMFWAARHSTPAPPPPLDSHIDWDLRTLLDTRTLLIRYTLPRGQDYYVIRMHRFLDGKELKDPPPDGGAASRVTADGDRTVQIELLWGETARGKSLVVRTPHSMMRVDGTFWNQLNFTTAAVRNSPEPFAVWEGWPIVGYATSRLRRDGTDATSGGSDFLEAIQTYHAVGAISIRSFATHQEAIDAAE